MASVRNRLGVLYDRMMQANVTCDEAIANYEETKARLIRGKTRDQAHIIKRDDQVLAELASRVAFNTAQANRHALRLLAELALAQHRDPGSFAPVPRQETMTGG